MSVGVNPIAPRFLAGVNIDGLPQWSPCNYCLWPNRSVKEWEEHMNQYHFPFAGNLQGQPLKWLWKVREVKDAEHPLNSYFIVEAVEKKPETSAKGSAKQQATKPVAKREPVLRQRPATPEPRVIEKCSKCGHAHQKWERHVRKQKQVEEGDTKEVLEVHAPQDRVIRGKTQ